MGKQGKKTEPAWAVGELWLDMAYDDNGLAYNQDRHRQDTINWIKGTGNTSTAFDFTTKAGLISLNIMSMSFARVIYFCITTC